MSNMDRYRGLNPQKASLHTLIEFLEDIDDEFEVQMWLDWIEAIKEQLSRLEDLES